MRRWLPLLLFGSLALAQNPWATIAETPLGLLGSPAGLLQTGPLGNADAVLPDGRLLTPAGRTFPAGDLPLFLALSPDGRYLVASNDGAGHQSLTLLDLKTGALSSLQPTPPVNPRTGKPIRHTLFGTLLFKGDQLFAAGGGSNQIYRFQLVQGHLVELPSISLAAPQMGVKTLNTFYPTGLALSPDGQTLYVTENLGNRLAMVDLATGTIRSVPVGVYPYAVTVAPQGTIFVSNWASHDVSVLSPQGELLGTISLPPSRIPETVHATSLPGAMALSPDGRRLYVVESDEDALAVISTRRAQLLKTVSLLPYPGLPGGLNPNAIALSPDGKRAYITLGGLNALEVVDLARDRVLGEIPTGWYPSAVIVSSDGKMLYVANAKGQGAGPNLESQWIGAMIAGSLEVIPVPDHRTLAQDTEQVVHNTVRVLPARDALGPIPYLPGLSSPIRHVIFIVRENKTYDEELGDLQRGNGDPALTLFGERYTPNAHALARQFVDFDNFYVDGEVTAQGHQWTAGGGPTDYVERTWPGYYSSRGRVWDSGIPGTPANTNPWGYLEPLAGGVNPSKDTGALPVTYPKLGYLFNAALRAGISFMDFGEFLEHDPKTGQIPPALLAHTDPNYPGWDLKIPDTYRASFLIQLIKKHTLPRFTYLYLMDDHTAGTEPGFPNPAAEVANNDQATGEVIAALSQSPYWKDSAVFVVEDDAQSGGDHVDAHRSVLYIASPWARQGFVDHVHLDQMSVLKTIELLLGLEPLSQNDAWATPLFSAFQNHPDLAPFQLQAEQVPDQFGPSTMNTAQSPLAQLSAELGFSRIGSVPGRLQAEILWTALYGPQGYQGYLKALHHLR